MEKFSNKEQHACMPIWDVDLHALSFLYFCYVFAFGAICRHHALFFSMVGQNKDDWTNGQLNKRTRGQEDKKENKKRDMRSLFFSKGQKGCKSLISY